MDTLVQDYSILLKSGFRLEHHLSNRCTISKDFRELPVSSSNGSSSEAQSSSEVNNDSVESDYFDAPLIYISQMLMEEEDLEHKPCMFYDSMALQTTEKYFSEALQEPRSNHSITEIGDLKNPNGSFLQGTYSTHSSVTASDVNSYVESRWIRSQEALEESPLQFPYVSSSEFSAIYSRAHQNDNFLMHDYSESKFKNPNFVAETEKMKHHSPNGSNGKKHQIEDMDSAEDIRSSKLMATSAADSSEPLEKYDKALLCLHSDPDSDDELELCSFPKESSSSGIVNKLKRPDRSKRRRPQRGIKVQGTVTEAVDLRSLLLQCSQAVASHDSRTAYELLRRIRQHSSPWGDATERVTHHFANALEARLAGTGTTIYASSGLKKISAAELLKAYQVGATACPFRRMPRIFANMCIRKATGRAATLHIIDFGILYGFQWSCLIQVLSQRPGGPPKVRITGIDFPQPGFRPAQRVEETGRRLAKYCKRFNVPFEYNAIAQKWETIQLKDLQIDRDRDEVLAVNCLFRMENVPDETVVTSSPRDAVLHLIKTINPDLFVHGVTNGTYNSPFFATRFREALFYFSSYYDMFEATLPKEDQQRFLIEREVIGRDALNVIACEGTERVERSETYKQWQARNLRAGFRQLPLDLESLDDVQDKVKRHYHKDFLVDGDDNWMHQGWRGKVICSVCCWKSIEQRQQ